MSSVITKISKKLHSSSSSGAGKKILVTGASGFVAAHILNEFLEHGYHVVGTVRSQESAEKVKKSHAKHVGNLSFAIVPDVAAPNAHDEAVKGVDGVIHTASPFQMEGVENNEEELLKPAMQGTKGILQSIQKNNPNIKRVVITSSFASIIDMNQGPRPGYTYSEADWNPVTYDEAKAGDGVVAYCASKTFAEKAAFDFVEQQNPKFSISTICPPMIYGPLDHAVSDMSKLNTSAADIYRLMNGSTKEVPPTGFFAFADVRDVARAHRLAYETPGAANQRYFVTGGNFSYQMICDILRTVPEIEKSKVPEGKPGSGLGAEVYKVDSSKAQRELGMTFMPLEKTVRDMAAGLLDLEKKIQSGSL